MCKWINGNLYWIYTSILFLFIVNTFIENLIITYIVGILAVPMLGISFLGATRLFRVMGTIFVVIGFGLYIYSGLPIYELPLYTTSTMPLLAFLTVLPWMNSVVRSGRYDRRIYEIMKVNVDDLGKLYVRSSFTTYILCTFINLSALSFTQDVLKKNMAKIKKQISDSFISKSTLRAFALALAWSPMEIIVAITVDATGVSYLTYLPWMFLFSFIIFTLDSLWSKRKLRQILYHELMNPVSIGIVLITGALATATVGTYGVTVTMTSMNTNQNPYRITLRNMPFALFYGAIGVLMGFLLL